MDLEGYTKQLIIKKDTDAVQKLKEKIMEFKKIPEAEAFEFKKILFRYKEMFLTM